MARLQRDDVTGTSESFPPVTAAEHTDTTKTSRSRLPLPELTALKIPAYRMWWISSASVLLNQFMTQVTLAWLILQLTDSAAWVVCSPQALRAPAMSVAPLAMTVLLNESSAWVW